MVGHKFLDILFSPNFILFCIRCFFMELGFFKREFRYLFKTSSGRVNVDIIGWQLKILFHSFKSLGKFNANIFFSLEIISKKLLHFW